MQREILTPQKAYTLLGEGRFKHEISQTPKTAYNYGGWNSSQIQFHKVLSGCRQNPAGDKNQNMVINEIFIKKER